jgi:hypothetical protein
MTANISEHLKKIEWPEQSAWEGVFHAIDRAIAARFLTRRVPASVSATVAQSWLRAGQIS